MNFYGPPPTLVASALSSVPTSLHASNKITDWVSGAGARPPVFLEGPTTDTKGNLYVVDVPYGRILCYSLEADEWKVTADYDGEPNGLALRDDGMLVVADYKQGMLKEAGAGSQLLCDPADGKITPLLARRNLERFKGPNDVIVSKKGEIYFTDQGQTGVTDPTGRVYRLCSDGKLDCLLDNGLSPNGLVLNPDETVLYVAMTRDNTVWRLPLHADGTTTKSCRFFYSFGVVGPDGITVDAKGNLFVCHPGLCCIFVVDKNGLPVARIDPPPGHGTSLTNVIFGSTDKDRKRLYFTDSTVGRICYLDWDCEGGTPLRSDVDSNAR